MKQYKISLAGDLGSGKSTVGEILAKKYELVKVSIGKIQREMAASLGLNTTSFNVYMEKHPEYDNILDDKLREHETKDGKFLFDSRMAWNFVPSSFKVYMTVDVEEAARRIIRAQRADEKYSTIDEAVSKLKERRFSEKNRYKQMYGVDILDMNNYDLVVKTDDKKAEEVALIIEQEFEKWLNK